MRRVKLATCALRGHLIVPSWEQWSGNQCYTCGHDKAAKQRERILGKTGDGKRG